MAEAFTWGAGGAKLTPEQLALARALLNRKRSQGVDTSPVGHWTAGAARVVDALGDVFQERRLNNQQAENDQYNAAQTEPLIAAISGGTAPVAAPVASSPVSSAPFDASAVQPEIRNGIVETASALGIDPVDLGTAISYETAGTFDPTKAGPTTQWGQHKGLIQFGEPQAQQYGVDWNNPIGSQLGANGAVANYLRSTGVKPGMGLMDIYSAINAGGVGRYGASDANNGGAPGTVADKVNQQMAGHREKAMALLGAQTPQAAIEQAAPSPSFRGSDYNSPMLTYDDRGARVERPYTDPSVSVQPNAMAPPMPAPVEVAARPIAAAPTPAPQQAAPPPNVLAQALRVMADPRANENTKAVAQALIQRQQAQEQAQQEQSVWMQRQQYAQQQQQNDPMRQLQMQEAQLKIAQMQDPNANVPDAVKSLDLRAQRAGLQPGSPEYNNFFITQGVKPPANVGAPPAGYQIVYDAQGNPSSMSPIPGSPAAMEAEARNRVVSNQQSGRSTSSDVITNAARLAREAAQAPGLPATGMIGSVLSGLPETNAAELRRQVGVLTSNATVENLNAMRAASPTGGALGSVTEKEGAMLAAKSGALDPNSPNFARDLEDYERTLLRVVHGQAKGDELFTQTRPSSNPDIQAAKDAIAKGAPRDMVIKRLQDAGLDTEGL